MSNRRKLKEEAASESKKGLSSQQNGEAPTRRTVIKRSIALLPYVVPAIHTFTMVGEAEAQMGGMGGGGGGMGGGMDMMGSPVMGM